MSTPAPRLQISPAPHVRQDMTSTRLMYEVLIATLPIIAFATWLFGPCAPLLVLASVAGALAAEWVVTRRSMGMRILGDGSAILTGVLLALTLPPSLPLWMAFLGGVVAILLGKSIWGGLGANMFNPALVGRAFLQAAFPAAITTWTAPVDRWLQLPVSTLAWPFLKASSDVVTTATPLGLSKFDHQVTGLRALFLGTTAGSLGETSAVLLMLCGAWLGIRRIFDWRLCVSPVVGAALLSGALHLWKPELYPSAAFMVLAGGLLFGCVFMCTDPVTTPITPRGAWIFGLGVGVLVVLIRLFGGLPEAVMYSILLMNGLTPLLNRLTQPRTFGG